MAKRNIVLGPNPEQYAQAGTEHAHQVALFMWAAMQANGPTKWHPVAIPELKWLFAIPNGGERNKIVAANLKAEGVRADVSDICLPVPRASWHGLYIELKRPESQGKRAGKATPGQLEWQTAMRGFSYGACVCVGWESARDTLLNYLSYPKFA